MQRQIRVRPVCAEHRELRGVAAAERPERSQNENQHDRWNQDLPDDGRSAMNRSPANTLGR